MARAKAKKNFRMIRTKESLSELIQSEQFIPYVEGAIDERCKDVRWTILGDCRYDLLWIVLSNVVSGEQAIECIPSFASPLANHPDGLDVEDAALAEIHSSEMWDKYKDRIRTP